MNKAFTCMRSPSKIMSLLCVITLAISGLVILRPSGLVKASTTATIIPVADSYTNQSEPSSNFGTNTSLRVDGSPLVRSYIRFDVNGINGPITKATLRIYANTSSSSGFAVKKVADNSWQEKAINFGNAPASADQLAHSNKFSSNVWVNVDLTSFVTANGSFSIVLVGIDQTAINLASREDGSHAPQLIVEVSTNQIPTATRTPVPSGTANPGPTKTINPLPTSTGTVPPGPTATQPGDNQPGFPIRAVFYYPWFPEAWNQQGFNPFTNFTPSLGYYDSGSVSVIRAHINAMTYGNVKAAILSWWGQGSNSDKRVSTILGATPGSSNPNFRWAIYYENESQGDPSVTQLQNDLQYIRSNYGANPSFLRVNGKFVVFVYAASSDGCGMADRWVQANNNLGHPAYIILKVFAGFRTCGNQPDSWHQYSPAVRTDQQSGFSFAISPGFWKKGENPRLVRDLAAWTANVKSMVSSGEPWQLITTFSEWGEGTSVESALEWASASGFGQYLDVLHTNGNGALPAPTSISNPTNTPRPSATSTRTGTVQPGPSPTPTRTTTPPNPTSSPPPNNDPILFYTSDLVSSGSLSRAQAVISTIKNLMSQHPGVPMLVASGGDNEQESSPSISNYTNYFGTTFGTFVTQGIFKQVRGNHDIQSQGSYTDYDGTVHSTGAAYWDYFGPNAHANNIEGKKLTDYSYDLGSWHIIGLDQLNGNVNQATLDFLKSDLSAHANTTCQMVYWHVPTYSSGAAHGDSPNLKPLNQAEYDAGVDIQLNGHDHDYQRFYPINPSGARDNAKGITTFVAGIGAEDNRSGSQNSIAQAASAVYLDTFPPNNGHAIGVIMFTLHANSADYQLYDANNGAILDQGTVTCH